MKSITEGKFGRGYFHFDFLKQSKVVTITGGIRAHPNDKIKALRS